MFLRDANWLYAGCISFSFVFSHFCHYTPKPILLLPCCSRPSLSFSLSPVWSHCFVGFCPLAISHFLFFVFFFCPHLPVFLPLPAMRSHLWLSIPHCSPLCSPFLVALCRCQIRPNSTTHKEGLNSLWFTSRYQTFLDAECGPLNRRCEHKMRTQSTVVMGGVRLSTRELKSVLLKCNLFQSSSLKV